jgi:microcystin-dependent protein
MSTMAFNKIDKTYPPGTEKGKVLDNVIREFKEQTETNLAAISNYNASGAVGTVPAIKTAVWTTAGRPTGADLVDKVTGFNSDLGVIEYYDLGSTSWKVAAATGLSSWTTTTRPASPFTGQYGHCSDLNVMERWSGTAWVRVNSPMRGDIKMWAGAVADIATKNPGWVLADGSSQTIDGATFTATDLRDRFIVGAGSSYAVGATGGAATVTLTANEMPSHTHGMTLQAYGANVGYSQNHGWAEDEQSSGRVWTNTTTATGGGGAHENRPPYYALCFLYKL